MNLASTFLFMCKEHPNPIGIKLENIVLVNILQTYFNNKKVKNIDLVNIFANICHCRMHKNHIYISTYINSNALS